jgi:hypothetical protein
MVGGAVVVRDRIDGGGSGGGGDEPLRLVCGTDLGPVCEALASADDGIEVTVEDEGRTADRLSGGRPDELGVDAWLTAAPWAGIVADNRATAGVEGDPVTSTSDVLARSPATIVALRDRAAALAGSCGGPVSWNCIGELAGRSWTDAGGEAAWGSVRPGLSPPETGNGLAVLSQAVSSRTVAVDLPAEWARNDLDDPAVSGWFDQLASQAKRAGGSVTDPLARFLVAPATFGMVGALESSSGPSVERAANGGQVDVIYPEPVVTADVTLSSLGEVPADDLVDRIGRDRLLDELAAAGWRVPDREPAPGVGAGPALPEDSGLASPGALQYLRERWRSVP